LCTDYDEMMVVVWLVPSVNDPLTGACDPSSLLSPLDFLQNQNIRQIPNSANQILFLEPSKSIKILISTVLADSRTYEDECES